MIKPLMSPKEQSSGAAQKGDPSPKVLAGAQAALPNRNWFLPSGNRERSSIKGKSNTV